jgi:hypothetical protein
MANIDAEEISKSFERNGAEGAADENPLGEAAKGYEPPKPVSDADPSDVTITLDGCPGPTAPNPAYGTFSDSPSSKTHSTTNPARPSQFDGSDSKEDAKETDKVRIATVSAPNPQLPAPQLLLPTTIDTDID